MHAFNPAAKMSGCQQPLQHLHRKAETEAEIPPDRTVFPLSCFRQSPTVSPKSLRADSTSCFSLYRHTRTSTRADAMIHHKPTELSHASVCLQPLFTTFFFFTKTK